MSVVNPQPSIMANFLGLGQAGNAAVIDSESIFGKRDHVEAASSFERAIQDQTQPSASSVQLTSPYALIEVGGQLVGHVDTHGTYKNARDQVGELSFDFYNNIQPLEGERYEQAVARSVAEALGGEVVNPQDRLRQSSEGLEEVEGLTVVSSVPHSAPDYSGQPIFMQQGHSQTLLNFQNYSQDEEKDEEAVDPLASLFSNAPQTPEDAAEEASAEEDFLAYQSRSTEEKVADSLDEEEEQGEKAVAAEKREQQHADNQQQALERQAQANSEEAVAQELGINTAEEELRHLFAAASRSVKSTSAFAQPAAAARSA